MKEFVVWYTNSAGKTARFVVWVRSKEEAEMNFMRAFQGSNFRIHRVEMVG